MVMSKIWGICFDCYVSDCSIRVYAYFDINISLCIES